MQGRGDEVAIRPVRAAGRVGHEAVGGLRTLLSRVLPALLLLAALLPSVASAQTLDPATRQPKTPEALTQGFGGAVTGAVVCALDALQRGDTRVTVQQAERCVLAPGIAGFVRGSRQDQMDRQLLEEFEATGLMIVIRGNTLVLDAQQPILFQRDSSTPTPFAQRILIAVARIVARFPQRAVDIVGHSSADENPDIALARADLAAVLLMRGGIGRDRIRMIDAGASEPVVNARATISAYRNRRVEVFLVPPY